MAKTAVSDWSTTAASNTDIDSIDIDEGCPSSGINNAIRELMAQIKTALGMTEKYATFTGSHTILATENGTFFRKTGTAATWAPQAAATCGDGWRVTIKVEGTPLTIDPQGVETIDGETTIVIPPGNTVDIWCNGTAFFSSLQPVTAWTPVLTFATPGNLSVTYSSQIGDYSVNGKVVTANFQIITSAFTHTTASGVLEISGLPLASKSTGNGMGSLEWGGVTKSAYTHLVPKVVAGDTRFRIVANGSAATPNTLLAADLPTGGSVRLVGALTYFTD